MLIESRIDTPHASRAVSLWVALIFCSALSACATKPLQLNSERIAAQFGSYHVSVLRQDDKMRISSLASDEQNRQITRTLAIVLFEPWVNAYAAEDQLIRDGGSIGSTFRTRGWNIRKPLLYSGALQVPASSHIVSELMRIELPVELAMHAYRFDVSRQGKTFTYAVLIELHHPEYLDMPQLKNIYGSAPASVGDNAASSLLLTARGVLADLSIAPAP